MIDPDGRDEYDFKNNGELLRVIPNSEKDIVNVVDNKGNRIDGKSIELEYGTISSYETKNKGGKYEYNKYQIKGNDNGKKVFEFLADNTKVEWGLINFFSNKSILTTSRDTNYEYGLHFELIASFNMIGDIKSVTHNHPGGTAYPSGLKNRKDDIGIARKYETKYGNYIQSYIYLPNKNRFVEENYIPYSSKSDFLDFRNHPDNKNVLFEFTITTKR